MKGFSVFFFLIVIIILYSSGISTSDIQPITQHYNVSINDVGLWALKLHGHSRYVDLGSHTLNPGEEYIFSLDLDNGEDTIYSCDFHWNARDKSIDIYDKSLGDYLNNTCEWIILSDGFYVFDISQNPQKFIKMYEW